MVLNYFVCIGLICYFYLLNNSNLVIFNLSLMVYYINVDLNIDIVNGYKMVILNG